MRKVFLVNHDRPATDADLSAAAGYGAAEVICGIPDALARAGISTFGYHEITETPAIPQAVSMRQARLALLNAGLLSSVKTAVAANDATEVWWDTSLVVERTNSVLASVQATLGLSDAQVDALFMAAAALP